MPGPVAAFRRGAAEDRVLLVGALAVWAIFSGLLLMKGGGGIRSVSYLTNLIVYLSALLFFVVPLAASRLWRDRPDGPLAFLGRLLTDGDIGIKLARGAPMLLALVLFMPAFSAMKSAIPLFSAYTWDDTWIGLDRALHGTDAWRFMQPIFGYPAVTSALSLLYHLWILLIYAGGVWFCFFVNDRELRARYFLVYFASWTILGIAVAFATASVGPCFLAPLLGDYRFEEQMDYLRHANEHFPVLTLPVQDQLIAWHQRGSHGLGRGITAMPSMHVSLAFLFFLAVRRVSKLAGVLFGLFFVAVFVGSVHLGYHYAVDGYVSVAGTWVLWVLAGLYVRHHRRAPERQPAMA